MRTITDHIVEGDSANHQLTIQSLGVPGAGVANHVYRVMWPSGEAMWPSGEAVLGTAYTGPSGFVWHDSYFQNGPIKEFGVNGVTQEALVAIVIDRLRSFQAGPFAGDYNARALQCFEDGLGWLQQRTKDRIARGVEGTHQK